MCKDRPGPARRNVDVKDAIRAKAFASGFDAAGFTCAAADPHDLLSLERYLAEGRHGDMTWMAREPTTRAAPDRLWPMARTVICVGLNYGPSLPNPGPLRSHRQPSSQNRDISAGWSDGGGNPFQVLSEPDRGYISVYARGRDYHLVMKKRLKEFARWLAATYECHVKVFVDTAPVMEKPLAQRAGLGWIGKHTNLVSRRFGSWLFLGEVFTTLDLEPDPAEVDHCGSCDACQRACPTAALRVPYQIEPRQCVSYLTIESRGNSSAELAAAFGNRVYGCDDCLAACPWNRFGEPSPHQELRPKPHLQRPLLAALQRLDDSSFRQFFAGTAIKRLGAARFARNVNAAIANRPDDRAKTA